MSEKFSPCTDGGIVKLCDDFYLVDGVVIYSSTAGVLDEHDEALHRLAHSCKYSKSTVRPYGEFTAFGFSHGTLAPYAQTSVMPFSMMPEAARTALVKERPEYAGKI